MRDRLDTPMNKGQPGATDWPFLIAPSNRNITEVNTMNSTFSFDAPYSREALNQFAAQIREVRGYIDCGYALLDEDTRFLAQGVAEILRAHGDTEATQAAREWALMVARGHAMNPEELLEFARALARSLISLPGVRA